MTGRLARLTALLTLVATTLLFPAAAWAGATASLTTTPVPLGSVVDLHVRVAVPAGSIVHFPRTLPATGSIESHGPVRWTAAPAPGW